MHISRYITVLLVVLTRSGLLHAQQHPDAAKLEGSWQLTSVETQLFSHPDNRLLEKRTVTGLDSINRINAFVPLELLFNGKDCTIAGKAGLENGKYMLSEDGMLAFQPAGTIIPPAAPTPSPEKQPFPLPVPTVLYRYGWQQPGILLLHMPEAYYRDKKRNAPVKLVYSCHYHKKN